MFAPVYKLSNTPHNRTHSYETLQEKTLCCMADAVGQNPCSQLQHENLIKDQMSLQLANLTTAEILARGKTFLFLFFFLMNETFCTPDPNFRNTFDEGHIYNKLETHSYHGIRCSSVIMQIG